MNVKAYAKLNLHLCVKNTVVNGLHKIEGLFQNIDLFDLIKINEKEGALSYKGPEFKNNTVLKIIDILKIRKGVDIEVKKAIPEKAGLGGGSSDAAAVLIGLNELLGLNLKYEEVMEIARKVGSDVPFFIKGGTCIVKGTGERVKKLKALENIDILLLNSKMKISTQDAYNKLDQNFIECNGNAEELYKKLKAKDFESINKTAFNSFDKLFSNEKWSREAKEILKNMGGINPMLTGTGSSFFAYYTKSNNFPETVGKFSFIDKGYEINV